MTETELKKVLFQALMMMEKSYRRGFQQGAFLQKEGIVEYDNIWSWRFEKTLKASFKPPLVDNTGYPLTSLHERALSNIGPYPELKLALQKYLEK